MRLASFNILHGRSLEDDRVDIDRFAAAVRDLDADILALQEVDRDQPRSHSHDFTAVAAEVMDAVDHRFVAALSGLAATTWMASTGAEQPGEAAYGIALVSRIPVQSWQVIRLPHLPFRFPMWLTDARKVIVANDEPRVCVAATVASPDGDLTVATTHLSFVPRWNEWQMRRLRQGLSATSGELVLMGDLNMSCERAVSSSGFRALAVDTPTFPAEVPHRQLDHVLARGDSLTVQSARTVRAPLSDHRALVVDVA